MIQPLLTQWGVVELCVLTQRLHRAETDRPDITHGDATNQRRAHMLVVVPGRRSRHHRAHTLVCSTPPADEINVEGVTTEPSAQDIAVSSPHPPIRAVRATSPQRTTAKPTEDAPASASVSGAPTARRSRRGGPRSSALLGMRRGRPDAPQPALVVA